MALVLARWWLTVLGGIFLGGGLVLHGQVALARHMRDEVAETFFLWRALGRMTFVFQDDTTQLALWLDEIPDRVLRESDRGAWALIVFGASLALMAPLCRKRGTRR
jgi:hypothetical protein